MKASLIIAVYKDVRALELILESLVTQTHKDFEVIVAEDGESEEMLSFVTQAQKKYPFVIKHTRQEDCGVRKARSQNNAIIASEGEYLIFIDGDCLLYSGFIDGHMTLAQKGRVLSGRRIDLNADLSAKIRGAILAPQEIEKKLLTKYLYLAFDKSVKFEQGIYFNPRGFIYKTFFANKKRSTAILGCNFSCWREDIVALNGFDEGYGESAVSDDMDWDWRFKGYGLKTVSCKNIANMMHLYHTAYDRGDASKHLTRMEKNRKNKEFICKKGLTSHM